MPESSIFCQSLLKFISIELVMLSDHYILCRPLLLLPSNFPGIRVFFNESALLIFDITIIIFGIFSNKLSLIKVYKLF